MFCTGIPVLRELGGNEISYFSPDESSGYVAKQIINRLEAETTSRWSRRAKHAYTWEQIYSLHIAPLIQEVSK